MHVYAYSGLFYFSVNQLHPHIHTILYCEVHQTIIQLHPLSGLWVRFPHIVSALITLEEPLDPKRPPNSKNIQSARHAVDPTNV